MANKVVTTKQSGGGGFNFEDKVTAFFMCYILAGRHPLDPSFGSIEKINLQVRVDYWLLDDLQLILNDGFTQRHCVFSIKSNPQFSKTTAPADFVSAAWEQYLGETGDIFDQNKDRIGLITSQLDTETKTKLNDLLGKSRCQDHNELPRRIKTAGYVSDEARKIFKSFSCPEELAEKYSITENDIGKLLSCIEHLDFDFECPSSSKKSEAISILRSILLEPSIKEALNLWETLCAIARDLRGLGGYIDLVILVDKLRGRYRLKDFPDYVPLWEQIKVKSLDALSLIPDKVADTVTIDRSAEIAGILKKFEKHQVVVLLGESGCGKTVVGKAIAKLEGKYSKVVWIDTNSIAVLDGLPSLDLFKNTIDENALLIIDGINQFYDEDQIRKLALLLKACLQESESSPWNILISSQPDDWAKVTYNLSRLSVDPAWEHEVITNPSYEALAPIWESFPPLKSLSLHMHLRSFLYKPKVLDLFARNIKKAGSAFDVTSFDKTFGSSADIGESHLIKWYWEHEVERQDDGLNRSVLLKSIAEKLANELVSDIPAADFSSPERFVIQELAKDRILRLHNDRVSFEHDIIADWGRLRILLEQFSNVQEYIKDRLSLPQWCKALRLLGVYLLEIPSDLSQWQKLFDSFSKIKSGGITAQDLLLEASIFSANPRANLDRLWAVLEKEDGKLLRRFLIRFMYSASFPNRFAYVIASQYKNEAMSELTSKYRDPYWVYWCSIIEFLYSQKTKVLSLANCQVAEIVDRWLRYSKINWPVRSEAADIALEIAEEELAINMSDLFCSNDSEVTKYAYRAGVAACNEEPERAIEFILTACSRKVPSGRIAKLILMYNEKVQLRQAQAEQRRTKEEKEQYKKISLDASQLIIGEGSIPPPWPDGPKDVVERRFHQVCIESESAIDTLYPLVLSNPDKAREAILALLIEAPRPKDPYGSRLHNYYGMAFVHGWYPAFYTNGPFYYFLNNHPKVGLDLIITLINFATERWAEERLSEGEENSYIEIELPIGKKRFIGDALTYYCWHRDVCMDSHILPSALMALEKWLYDILDDEQRKGGAIEAINQILKYSTSLASVGLLISVGKKSPALFEDVLLPLLSIPEFYSWDNEHVSKSEGLQMISWAGKGEVFWKMAQEFHEMEHRRVRLLELVPDIFILRENTREFFIASRKQWIERFESKIFGTVSSDVLENLICWFDISNWEISEDPELGTQYAYNMPGEVKQRRELELKDIEEKQLLISLPMTFRRILEGKNETIPEQIWEAIQKVNSIELKTDDSDFDILSKENSICGGIVVLFRHHREWLEQRPDKERWCIAKIIEIINAPPAEAEMFDSEVSTSNWMWDRYCAEVMPMIWTEEPENHAYRKCIVILALNKHYETIEILFKSTAEYRGVLGEHFKQLINFISRYAHARWRFIQEQYSDRKTFDLDLWIESESQHFVDGKMPAIKETWADIAKNEIIRRKKLYKKERAKRGGNWKTPKDEYFDFRLMNAAFSWMPPLDKALNEEERADWLIFWQQAISWTIGALETEEDGEISGTPSSWERWLFEQIATQVLRLADSEKPEELWQPILNLGAEGHYWVDDFLVEWFIKGLSCGVVSSNFIERWKAIIEYAFSSGKWSAGGRFWFHRNKLWCGLFGFNYLVGTLWDETKELIVSDMLPYYERWANNFLANPECAVSFIYFLKRPAAKSIIAESLVWLDKASDKSGEKFFTDRHYDTQKSLANLLEISWKNQSDVIRGHVEAYSAFKNLLRKLVDLQNSQAMDIQNNLLS